MHCSLFYFHAFQLSFQWVLYSQHDPCKRSFLNQQPCIWKLTENLLMEVKLFFDITHILEICSNLKFRSATLKNFLGTRFLDSNSFSTSGGDFPQSRDGQNWGRNIEQLCRPTKGSKVPGNSQFLSHMFRWLTFKIS